MIYVELVCDDLRDLVDIRRHGSMCLLRKIILNYQNAKSENV